MKFEWDEIKNSENQAKHGISFEYASKVFASTYELEFDLEHSTHDEDRFRAYGQIHGEAIIVVFVEVVEDTIRIISAFRE